MPIFWIKKKVCSPLFNFFFDQELEAAHLRSVQDVAQHWLTDPNYQRNGIYLGIFS